MEKSLCEILLHNYPRNSEVKELYSTTIANFVFNCILSCTAIMFNIVTIHAIRKTSSLPKCSLLIKWSLQNNPDCNTYKAYYIFAYFFSAASSSGVLAVSVDRFLAIHLHLRYQQNCDSQACCYCGDLIMGVMFISSFFNVLCSARYLFTF